jgi:hypothetical protein
MICISCGNTAAYAVRTFYLNGERQDICNACGADNRTGAVPDAYFDAKKPTFEALCDEMGRPYEITSKRHKAEIMKKLGVSEVGDRVNGARGGGKDWIEGTREYRKRNFENAKPSIREAYRQYLSNVRRKS